MTALPKLSYEGFCISERRQKGGRQTGKAAKIKSSMEDLDDRKVEGKHDKSRKTGERMEMKKDRCCWWCCW